MALVFLAHSFADADRELAVKIDRFLSSYELITISGRTAGGNALTPEICARIDRADALVALLSRHREMADGGWAPSDWVKDELAYARARQKHSIALVEDGVKILGAYRENEYIELRRAQPLDAFLYLSEFVQKLKDDLGRPVRVRLRPNEAAEVAIDEGSSVICKYRFKREDGEITSWRTGRAYEEEAGIYLYAMGASDRRMIQVSVEAPYGTWRSPFSSYAILADLKQK